MGEKFINKFNEEFDEKTMMKIVIRDIFLKQMWSIRKLYLILISIYNLYRREKKKKSRKTYLQYRRPTKICCSYKSLKRSTKSWLKIKKVHRVIQFYQKAQLKPYIDMNTEQKANLKQISLS